MRQQIPGKLPVETAKVVLPSVNPYRVIRIASSVSRPNCVPPASPVDFSTGQIYDLGT
jgi:hypothetical protein